MDTLPYADIVILALIAGFVLLRLRGVLGQKTGHEDPQFFKRTLSPEESAVEEEPIVQIAGRGEKSKAIEDADFYMQSVTDASVISVVNEIKKKDPQFSATAFLHGAKMAYEMVFDAFAKGDKKTLEMLLDGPLCAVFSAEIDKRSAGATITETTLLSVRPRHIMRASLVGSLARIAVSFDSEQVSLVRDKEGKILEGNASASHPMDDEWVFERDVSSKNPNWKIVET